MKKYLFILIILSFVLLGGCSLEKTVRDNYGDSIILSTGDIVYTTGLKDYESLWLYPDVTGDNILYEQFKKQGKRCNETDYGIGGGRGCSNITGYNHIYTISKRGLQIEAYSNSLPNSIDNPGIFTSSIISSFILSGNRLYDSYGSGILSDHYIAYHTILSGQSIQSMLDDSPDSILSYNQYKKAQGQEYIDNMVMYQDMNEEGDNTTMMLRYVIQTGKDYYYTVFDTSVGCAPGPCGMDRHKFIYFLK